MIDDHAGAGPHIERGEPFASTVHDVLRLDWQAQFALARDLLIRHYSHTRCSTAMPAISRPGVSPFAC
jgi:hypothetical protein